MIYSCYFFIYIFIKYLDLEIRLWREEIIFLVCEIFPLSQSFIDINGLISRILYQVKFKLVLQSSTSLDNAAYIDI